MPNKSNDKLITPFYLIKKYHKNCILSVNWIFWGWSQSKCQYQTHQANTFYLGCGELFPSHFKNQPTSRITFDTVVCHESWPYLKSCIIQHSICICHNCNYLQTFSTMHSGQFGTNFPPLQHCCKNFLVIHFFFIFKLLL